MAAGRIMLERRRDLTAQRTNVAFETTLASRSFAPWIRRLKDSGYSFNLFYFCLPTPEVAIERVRVRKLLGGHWLPLGSSTTGNVPMVFMRDGKIVDVNTSDIPIPDDILAEISGT